MSRGYLLYQGHKIPHVSTELKDGRVIFGFSISLPGMVQWPEPRPGLPGKPGGFLIYGSDDKLIMAHPGRMNGDFWTEDGTFNIYLPVAITEVRWCE